MRYVIFKGESIKDLVSRLFQLPDKTAKTAKQATDALLAANPELRNPSKVPAGTILKIPDHAPPLNPSETVPPSMMRQFAVANQMRQTLYVLNGNLQQIESRATEAVQTFLNFVQSDRAQALAQRSPEIRGQLSHTISFAEDSTQALETETKLRSELVGELQKSLQVVPRK